MNASLLHPRYWPTWFGLGLLRLLVLMPWPWQRGLGRAFGLLLSALAGSRRRVAARNIERCFAELSEAEQQALLKRHFTSLGLFLFETGLAWWASDQRIARLSRLEGLDNLQQALARGRGVLLVAGHFTHLELGARVINRCEPLHPMYRVHANEVLEYFIKRRRQRYVPYVIARQQLRQIIRTLNANKMVWYAPDQDPGRQQSEFAPFFGIATATHTATLRLAQRTGAAVVPLEQRRDEDGKFLVRLRPPLSDFPSDDPVQDLTRLNAELEECVRLAPDQYLWIHRRFKTRPEGEADFYA